MNKNISSDKHGYRADSKGGSNHNENTNSQESSPSEISERQGGWKSWLKNISIFPFIVLIKFYRTCISPYTPPTCRFTPTCSEYALQAFRKHGPFKGLYLTVRRLLRCHPWGGSGYDPVP